MASIFLMKEAAKYDPPGVAGGLTRMVNHLLAKSQTYLIKRKRLGISWVVKYQTKIEQKRLRTSLNLRLMQKHCLTV